MMDNVFLSRSTAGFCFIYRLYRRLLFHFTNSTAGLVFLDDVVHLLGTALVEAHVAVVALHELVDGSEDDFLVVVVLEGLDETQLQFGLVVDIDEFGEFLA